MPLPARLRPPQYSSISVYLLPPPRRLCFCPCQFVCLSYQLQHSATMRSALKWKYIFFHPFLGWGF